ncbi:endonuclease/exonuclease/phosphatase family protein [Bifidobacterium sp. ESL0763]|uniref:endonuclease/exonuclease/phosphatase family protein n=1 Tax=Bifidobacterium sp. ESL0763 TaxID=2983227 RepID=UPI0023F7513A|nr:endonuclease/exonuclease/phosphatase family protein [Bifidobacterium sp. ESL0763]MDF7664240.1 endonuclease/exonuclease/phosphatase family protein [Bifidobacterium sp. ESL0763]
MAGTRRRGASAKAPKSGKTSKSAKARKPKKAKGKGKHIGFVRGLLAVLAWLLLVPTLVGAIARELPEELQALPYVPTLVAAAPWLLLPAVLALVLALAGRRWVAAVLSVLCVGLLGFYQAPYFKASRLPQAAVTAVDQAHADLDDNYARVMTLNVYKGRADPQAIVELVRDKRVEVLALQETTRPFVRALDAAGIGEYLPYSQVSSSDGTYGNGLWSATPLDSPADDDVDSSASFMPGGTVGFGRSEVRFVSVHTTSPKPGYWRQWNESLDELALMRSHANTRYVFMGDFNATTDHTAFRNILGSRFRDAASVSGHGPAFTWPGDIPGVPHLVGIDHVLVDQGIDAGQVSVEPVRGSDHAALLATIAVR